MPEGERVLPREPLSEAGALGSTPAVQPRVWWDPRHPEPPQPSRSPGPRRRAGRGRRLGPKAKAGGGAGPRAQPRTGGRIQKRAAAAAQFLQLITSVGVSGGAGERVRAPGKAGGRAHKVCACGCASGGLARLPERRVGGPRAERPGAKGRAGSGRGRGEAMRPAEPVPPR